MSDVIVDGTELGPVGQEIVYENDRVRVWHIRLEPGERQPLHRHDHPYLVVAIEGAKNVVQTIDGTRIDADEPTGGVVYRDPGQCTCSPMSETRLTWLGWSNSSRPAERGPTRRAARRWRSGVPGA